MIPREEILITKALADKGHRCEMPAETVAELCRVYLAWVDAPVRVLDMSSGTYSIGVKYRLVLEGEDGRG